MVNELEEIDVDAGERIDMAVKKLAAAAPAFMVFNGIRVEALAGEAPAELFAKWSVACEQRAAAQVRKRTDRLEEATSLLRRWIARGFPMGGSDLWDDTKTFLGS